MMLQPTSAHVLLPLLQFMQVQLPLRLGWAELTSYCHCCHSYRCCCCYCHPGFYNVEELASWLQAQMPLRTVYLKYR